MEFTVVNLLLIVLSGSCDLYQYFSKILDYKLAGQLHLDVKYSLVCLLLLSGISGSQAIIIEALLLDEWLRYNVRLQKF